MTIQTELMLSIINGKLSILEINAKQTLLQKNNIPHEYEERLRAAIRNEDMASLEEIFGELLATIKYLGFEKFPAGYMLKHNGYMFGRGLRTRSGIKSDMTFTCRTTNSLM